MRKFKMANSFFCGVAADKSSGPRRPRFPLTLPGALPSPRHLLSAHSQVLLLIQLYRHRYYNVFRRHSHGPCTPTRYSTPVSHTRNMKKKHSLIRFSSPISVGPLLLGYLFNYGLYGILILQTCKHISMSL